MIIGVSGKIDSGKSLVCEVFGKLALEYNKRSVIKSFAAPIYRLVSDLTGISSGEIKGRKKRKEKLVIGDIETNYRSIMQTIGDGLRQYVGDDVWLNGLFGSGNQQAVTDLTWINDWWIIEDLRYPNEAEKIKSLGGYLIRVNRDDAQDNTHIAENSLSKWSEWDLIITNNYKSVDEARSEIHKIANEFVKEVLYGD